MRLLIPVFLLLLFASTPATTQPVVLTGIDILELDNYAPLFGKKVGLITNQTGIDRNGVRTIDILARAKGVTLAAIFSPEHGITGAEDREGIADAIDSATGIRIYSLYGATRRPTPAMLAGIDILVYDIQDVGARYYTYITTLGYALEEAEKAKKKFIVLDRPVAIRGDIVEGDILADSLKSFNGYYPVPMRYGMTPGEIAEMVKDTEKLDVDLEVVKCRGWIRTMWFDETGLPWRNPSPNIRNLNEAVLYSGLGPLEATNLSVGRGTDSPFEMYGAPFLDGKRLADMMNAVYVAGAKFAPVEFTPASGPFKGEVCKGVRVIVTNRTALRPSVIMIKLANEIKRQSPRWNYRTREFEKMLGTKSMISMLDANECTCTMTTTFNARAAQFENARKKYLLY